MTSSKAYKKVSLEPLQAWVDLLRLKKTGPSWTGDR